MKYILLLILCTILSCGKKNAVNSTQTSTNAYSSTSALEGTYDLIDGNNSFDCAANIRIKNECNGIKVYNNDSSVDEYCNLNAPNINDKRQVSINGKISNNDHSNRRMPGRGNTFEQEATWNLNNDILMKEYKVNNRSIRCTYQKR